MKQAEIIEAVNAQQTIILDRLAKLSETDYIAIKIAEGKATKTEYAATIAQRQQYRDDINASQEEINRLEALTPEDSEPETVE